MKKFFFFLVLLTGGLGVVFGQFGRPNQGDQNQKKAVSASYLLSSGQIVLSYEGTVPFKIFSETGRGLEFYRTDTITSYVIKVPKNEDLVVGIGIKNGEDQAIWPYAEIRKRINAGDTICKISEKDIKRMSTAENKRLKIRLTAKGYKIFFEPENGSGKKRGSVEPISLGYNEISKSIDVPIGQFYIKISYTDPEGMFHSTVFVPKHVTSRDGHLDISEENLKNAVQLRW